MSPPRPPVCLRPAAAGPRRAARGFTLVELVVVLLLMAVLATVGASRFASRDAFAVQSVADQLVSGLRHARALAIARRATVHVQLGAVPAALAVCLDAGCAQPLPAPGGAPWIEDADGVQLGAALAFSIDADGTPSLAAVQTVQVASSDGSVLAPPIRIEPGSGHVHSP